MIKNPTPRRIRKARSMAERIVVERKLYIMRYRERLYDSILGPDEDFGADSVPSVNDGRSSTEKGAVFWD